MAEYAHVRELFRACDSLLAVLESDGTVHGTTRIAVGGVAAALRHVAMDWPLVVQEWHELRSREQQLEEWAEHLAHEVAGLRRQLEERDSGAAVT
jgi:hypothetical protein